MKKLLVIADPTDNEPLAIEKSLSLSKYDDSTIHIAVFCYVPLKGLAESTNASEAEIKKKIIVEQEKKWQQVISQYRGTASLTYELVWEKNISLWVGDHCGNQPYDMVVKTGHRSESFLHTPSDWQLFRHSPVPVYIVSPKTVKNRLAILAAIDVLTENEDNKLLNREVLEKAFQLAMQVNAELKVCYAIHIPKLVRDMDLIDVPRKVRELSEKARQEVSPILKEYQLDEDSFYVQEGNPGKVIAQFANKLKVACTVIGSIGRSGITGKVVGNTCEKALHYIRSDLLVVSRRGS